MFAIRNMALFTDAFCGMMSLIRNMAVFADGRGILMRTIRNMALFTDAGTGYEGKSSLRMLMSSFRSRLVCWFDALYLK